MSDDYKKRLIGILEGTELSEDQKAKLEDIFPELRQSEDESIRKWIIAELEDSLHNIEALYSRDYDNRDDDDIVREDCLIKAIDWLEKQKGNPLSVWSENDHEMVYCIRKIIEKYAFSQSAVDINGDLCEKEYIDADDWMKSIEGRLMQQPQSNWKPSKKQIIALRWILNNVPYCEHKEEISGLLEEFKKL